MIRLLVIKIEHQRTVKQIKENITAVTPSLEELFSDKNGTKENNYEPYRCAG